MIIKLKEENEAPLCLLLVGNKSDLNRNVNYEDAVQLSRLLSCEYIETSAKENKNVNEIFYKIVKNIINSDNNIFQKDFLPFNNYLNVNQFRTNFKKNNSKNNCLIH
jgi:Ras-related protein Rab-8A